MNRIDNPKGILRFEEILGPLEIAESEEYWFHFGGRDSQDQDRLMTNSKVLDSLDTWLAMALDPPSLPKISTQTAEAEAFTYYEPRLNSPLPYARLISFLDQRQFLSQTVFVSMNYDILLDRALNVAPVFFPDYDLEDFVKDSKLAKWSQGRIPVKLLKLHGSLNWRMCETCHLLRNTGNDVVWPRSQCNDCGNKTAKPMLIRPTLLKDFRHRVWRDLWRKAGHTLAGASHWIFVGYSLPLADVWMLRLLAQSARSGPISTREKLVTVVNPDPGVLDRFRLLFPSAKGHQGSFEAWIDKCIENGKLIME